MHHAEIQNGQSKRNKPTYRNALDLLEKVVAVSHVDVLVKLLLEGRFIRNAEAANADYFT